MYDNWLVEQGTLKNDVVDGRTVGFSFGVRIANYRGVFLSLINGFYVNVDGEDYPVEVQSLEINGKPPRSLDEIAKAVWEHWDLEDTAYVHIAKDGGLAPGIHRIKYMESSVQGYGFMPQILAWVENPPHPGDPASGGKTDSITVFELELIGAGE